MCVSALTHTHDHSGYLYVDLQLKGHLPLTEHNPSKKASLIPKLLSMTGYSHQPVSGQERSQESFKPVESFKPPS